MNKKLTSTLIMFTLVESSIIIVGSAGAIKNLEPKRIIYKDYDK